MRGEIEIKIRMKRKIMEINEIKLVVDHMVAHIARFISPKDIGQQIAPIKNSRN